MFSAPKMLPQVDGKVDIITTKYIPMMNVSGKARAGRNGLRFPETHQDRFFFLNPEPINKSSSVVEAKEGISEESKNPKL